MSHVFLTKQVLPQLYLFRYLKENKACKTDIYLLPRQLDEEVALCGFRQWIQFTRQRVGAFLENI